jgi:phosphatidylserine/phosphatidylglycerophosphate/cardiolipin synthase-like enzyme
MTSILRQLSLPNLISLANAIADSRLALPLTEMALLSNVPDSLANPVAAELNRLLNNGVAPSHIAYTLRLLAEDRIETQKLRDRVDLVWTGQEFAGSASRDTRIVVQELFGSAKHSVLVSSFALDKSASTRALFQTLAKQMNTFPNLQVRIFLNVHRPYQDLTPESTLLRQFAEFFRKEIWSGSKLPEVFHDPRSLSIELDKRACLHAKCVVVDEEKVLVTSANFTEAAHERNIEAGILIVDAAIARTIINQFNSLTGRNILQQIAL